MSHDEPRRASVIIGGYFGRPAFYAGMKSRIEDISQQPARIVPVSFSMWALAAVPAGWSLILGSIDRTVLETLSFDDPEKLSLIGHSIGGLFLRLYARALCGEGKSLAAAARIDRIISLGSPHQNRSRILHGGLLTRALRRRGRGISGSSGIRILCVAGRRVRGNLDGTPEEKRAARIYAKISGESRAWGDGVVPLSSAVLPGTEPIILDGVGHSPLSGGEWYGSPDVVSRWWTASAGVE